MEKRKKMGLEARRFSHNFDAKWFERQLELHNLTKSELGRHLSMDRSLVVKLLNGDRKMHIPEAVKLSNIFREPLETILQRAGMPIPAEESSKGLEISGWVNGEMEVVWQPPSGRKEAPLPASGVIKDVNVVRCQTIGSPFAGLSGGLAYFKGDPKAATARGVDADCVNRLCIARISSGQWYLTVVQRGYDAGTYNLCYLNGQVFIESASLECAFPVIWMKF